MEYALTAIMYGMKNEINFIMKTIKEYLSTPEGVEQKWNVINEILEGFDFDGFI